MKSSLVLVLVSLIHFSVSDHATCYFPDGTKAPDTDIPSNKTSEAGFAPCCGANAEYLSSGLCLYGGSIARGSCTDLTWQDSACPQACASVNPSEGLGIYVVGYTSVVNQFYWCCGMPNNGSCPNNDAPMKLHAGTVVPQIDVATQTTTSTATAVTITTTATPTTSHNSSSSNNVAIGAGVGVAVGIALVGAMVLAFMMKTRKDKQRKQGTGYENLQGTDWSTVPVHNSKEEVHQVKVGELYVEPVRHEIYGDFNR